MIVKHWEKVQVLYTSRHAQVPRRDRPFKAQA